MQLQTNTIIVACIVAIIAPAILAVGNNRLNRKNQELQWKREDELEQRRLDREKDAEKNQDTRFTAIEDQTKVIHSLVNSELTRAYENDLESTKEAKTNLQRIIDLSIDANGFADPADTVELNNLTVRINDLTRIISNRNNQQREIDDRLYPTYGDDTNE